MFIKDLIQSPMKVNRQTSTVFSRHKYASFWLGYRTQGSTNPSTGKFVLQKKSNQANCAEKHYKIRQM